MCTLGLTLSVGQNVGEPMHSVFCGFALPLDSADSHLAVGQAGPDRPVESMSSKMAQSTGSQNPQV